MHCEYATVTASTDLSTGDTTISAVGVAPTEDTLVEVLNELSAEGWQVDGVLPKVTVDGVQHSTLLLVSFPPEMIEAAGLLAARGHTWR